MGLTFPVSTLFTLSWTLLDQNNNPINNATVVANLYAGRSLRNPLDVPGTLVPPIVDLTLAYQPASAGIYSAAVPATLDPELDGVGYVLVIDGLTSGTPIFHQEIPVVLETAGAAIDLTTVDQFKSYESGLTPFTSDPSDALIQQMITAWSVQFLRLTGMGDQGGDFTQSPFTAICQWDEIYDGTGSDRLMLRNRPVRSVLSLNVNGVNAQAAGAFPAAGYVIDGSKRAIVLRGGGGVGIGPASAASWQAGSFRALNSGLRFWRGTQNIAISYMAGYTDVPPDIVMMSNMVIDLTYRQRPWLGEKSRDVAGGGGSITFDWNIPDTAQTVIDFYSRTL